jgi:UPF0755 protein
VAERTPAEREAARLERERRRAQRLDEEPAERLAGVAGPDGQTEADRVDLTDTAEPGHAEASNGSQPTNGAAAVNQETEEFVPGPDADAGLDEEDWLEDDEYQDDAELPSGTRRVPRSERIGSASPVPERKRSRPLRQRRRKGPVQRHRPADGRPNRKHSIAGRFFGVLAIVAVAAGIWFLFELFQPFHSTGHKPVTVTIPTHSGVGTIGKLLEREGVVSSSFFFELRATISGDRSNLRSGTYHLHQGMSYGDVLQVLTTAPPAAKVTNLTIIEGKTRRQVDTLLRSQGVRGSYFQSTRHSHLLDPRHYAAPRGTNSLEGFLFPSTYQLREPISAAALISDQLKTFRERFAKVNMSYPRSRHMTPYDELIVASMVQAEAQTEHDRPLIASVIYNRLARGMPLQIDATTRYATGNYTKPLTVSELNSSSPYNTRIHTGLPPTPINSPGMASIQAAAHPAHTNYLYFVVKPCGNGEHAFASSFSQFQAEVARYQRARSSQGGRSPEHC